MVVITLYQINIARFFLLKNYMIILGLYHSSCYGCNLSLLLILCFMLLRIFDSSSTQCYNSSSHENNHFSFHFFLKHTMCFISAVILRRCAKFSSEVTQSEISKTTYILLRHKFVKTIQYIDSTPLDNTMI